MKHLSRACRRSACATVLGTGFIARGAKGSSRVGEDSKGISLVLEIAPNLVNVAQKTGV